jgi:hypothetical protein
MQKKMKKISYFFVKEENLTAKMRGREENLTRSKEKRTQIKRIITIGYGFLLYS